MFCPQCGSQNEETAVHCTRCGSLINMAAGAPPPPPQQFVPPQQYVQPPIYQAGQMPPPQPIPNYMVQAVLVTLFCCLPLGIVAIFKANGINKKIAAGDFAGALADSKSNKTLLWVGCIVGLVVSVLYFMTRMNS
jgi:predicted secreted protein